MPWTTLCFVCFYRPAFCRVCVFILWTSCLLINKYIKKIKKYQFHWVCAAHLKYRSLLLKNARTAAFTVHATRVTIFGDSDSTRVMLRKMVTRLDSSHVFHRMTRLESQSMTRVRVIFTKSLSCWQTNPLHVHLKKWTFFASVMIKIGANFLFCLSSHSMLHLRIKRPNLCRGRP